jgi:hypothetical protein
MKSKKFTIALLLTLIVFFSFLLRTYNQHNWLYFKMDQSRDAMLVAHALDNGLGYLPLLGPRAGATEVDNGYLRLGPAFYYFQYFSGLITGSRSPDVFAYPDLFFSLTTILLLYFFLRLYFQRYVSILLTIMYAFSFLVIQYSRFAWNPNSLLFFTLLSFYGMLRFYSEEKVRKKYLWLSLWSMGLAIGSQLHFFGFFCLLAISGLFVLIKSKIWKKESMNAFRNRKTVKTILSFAGTAIIIFALFYIPVIASDIIKKGENSKNFFQAISSKPDNKPLISKIKENTEEQVKYYCIISTANCYKGDAYDSPVYSIFTLIILISGFGSLLYFLRKEKNNNFILLILLWVSVFFALTIPTAFQLRPRFFIFVFPIPFIFLGFLFKLIEKKKLFYYALAGATTGLILILNISGTLAWFNEQKMSQLEDATADRTLILKTKDGVTLGQLERAADYIYEKRRSDKTIYYYVKPEHVMPLKYLFYLKNDPTLNYSPIKFNGDPEAQFFAVVPSHRGIEPIEEKYGKDFIVLNHESFGQIAAYEISFNNREIKNDFRFNKERNPTDRLFWKDIFSPEKRGEVTEINDVE